MATEKILAWITPTKVRTITAKDMLSRSLIVAVETDVRLPRLWLCSEAREDDEEYQSPVDLLFADLEERDPDHFAVKQYRKYKLAAGKRCV